MKKRSIKLSGLWYIGIASLCLIYMHDFSKILYYRPDSQFYDLLIGSYLYVALPIFCFSAAAFLAIVVYTLVPGTIPKVYRKIFLGVALVIFLIYAVLLLLMVLIPDSILFTSAVLKYPIAFAAPGVLFALGIHKK